MNVTYINSSNSGGRSIIAIACRIMMLALPLWTATLSSAENLTSDRGRPFGEGEILGFPGVDYFEGDLSHELRVTDPLLARLTLGEWAQVSLPRVNPFSGAAPSALVFEGIPCPILSSEFSGIFPSGFGSVEFHDFPAAAWWGPTAGNGAVQCRAPLFDPDTPWIAGAWAGVQDRSGVHLRFPGDALTASAAARPGKGSDDSQGLDVWTMSARGRYSVSESLHLSAGGVDLRTISGARWTSLYGELKKGTGSFNEWFLKPYYQRAKAGSIEVSEGGAEGRYLFNMAGFIESQLVAGGAVVSREDAVQSEQVGRGYIQNTESFDALGLVMGDLAMRTDYERGRRPSFSVVTGVQGRYGPIGIFSSFERSGRRIAAIAGRQERLGIRFRPGDPYDISLYASEGESSVWGGFHGPGAALRCELRDPLPPVVWRTTATVEAQTLLTARAGRVREAFGEVGFDLGAVSRLVGRIRCRDRVSPGWETMLDLILGRGFHLDGQYTRLVLAERVEKTWTIGVRYVW